MMKRLTALCLLLLYAVSASGATFNLHFCGGELEEVSLAGLGHKGCCCAKLVMKESCCKDAQVIVKIDNEHKQLEESTLPVTFLNVVPFEVPSLTVFHPVSLPVITVPRSGAPPGVAENNDLLVLNCVFRI